jgi:hypothetical protein
MAHPSDPGQTPTAPHADATPLIVHLRELIAALDRRVPQIERLGESAIAHDAAELKRVALDRIAQLEARADSPAPVNRADGP